MCPPTLDLDNYNPPHTPFPPPRDSLLSARGGFFFFFLSWNQSLNLYVRLAGTPSVTQAGLGFFVDPPASFSWVLSVWSLWKNLEEWEGRKGGPCRGAGIGCPAGLGEEPRVVCLLLGSCLRVDWGLTVSNAMLHRVVWNRGRLDS